MRRKLNNTILISRSQPATRIDTKPQPYLNSRLTKTLDRFGPIPVQNVKRDSGAHVHTKNPHLVTDKDKNAQTGRWVYNVIMLKEQFQNETTKNNKIEHRSTKQSFTKKQVWPLKKSSRIEQIENLQSQFADTRLHHIEDYHYHNQITNKPPVDYQINPTPMSNSRDTNLSSFSSATQIHDVDALEKSLKTPRKLPTVQSKDSSIDEYDDSSRCVFTTRQMLIAIGVIFAILFVGSLIAIFVTVFVTKDGSTSSSGKSFLAKEDSRSGVIHDQCPLNMLNIADTSCEGQAPYKYYSCCQIAVSNRYTIQFALQHDTLYGHWYLDDISVVQNNNTQLIMNGGFESSLISWSVEISANSTSDTHVDTVTGTAHSGSAYLYVESKHYPTYITQTFQVVQGEYMNVSFWWGYSGGLKLGQMCTAIVKLIPLF